MTARLLVLAAAGCADPGDAFDEFQARPRPIVEAPEDSGQTSGPLPAAAQISGTYLSIISSTLSPRKPIVYLLEVEATQVGAGLRLTMRDQPLSLADRRTPVGELSPWRQVDVAADGVYLERREQVITPGEANAVLPGIATNADLTLMGHVSAAEGASPDAPFSFWCGTFDGTLYEPVQQPFRGTFTVSRITDPARYPEPVIDCAKQPAEPLP